MSLIPAYELIAATAALGATAPATAAGPVNQSISLTAA
jgi:hypothetical protein